MISPGGERADEARLVTALFGLGLHKYHLRKPGWSGERLQQLVEALPSEYRDRLVFHSHHHLLAAHGLGGIHRPNEGSVSESPEKAAVKYLSCSCHDLESLHRLDGHCDAILLAPIFASLSKPGHGPSDRFSRTQLLSALARRSPGARAKTRVYALGGITSATTADAAALGFDGVAALGAVWGAPDPLKAFLELQEICAAQAARQGGGRHHEFAARGSA